MKSDRGASSLPYKIDLVPNEHGGDYARVPDFPGIFTGGRTPEEAMRNVFEALDLMIEEYEDRGLPLPEPRPHDHA